MKQNFTPEKRTQEDPKSSNHNRNNNTQSLFTYQSLCGKGFEVSVNNATIKSPEHIIRVYACARAMCLIIPYISYYLYKKVFYGFYCLHCVFGYKGLIHKELSVNNGLFTLFIIVAEFHSDKRVLISE